MKPFLIPSDFDHDLYANNSFFGFCYHSGYKHIVMPLKEGATSYYETQFKVLQNVTQLHIFVEVSYNINILDIDPPQWGRYRTYIYLRNKKFYSFL